MTDAEKALDDLIGLAASLSHNCGKISALSKPIREALRAQEKPVEVNGASLCVTILDTQPDKEFGTWQVIDVLESIKSLGLKIIDGG